MSEQWFADTLELADVCRAVVLDTEAGGSIRDSGVFIPGRPGVDLDDEADWGPIVLPLRTVIRRTDENGTVDHEDGEEGHYFENLSALKAVFGKRGLITLKRTIPHIGTVRALCKLTTDPLMLDGGVTYQWNLLVPSGSWQDDSESSATGDPPSVTTSGDREIHDPRLSISAAGETEFTLADGTVYTITAAAGPTYPVVVDVGAGTVVDAGSADASGDVTFSHEHWFRLDAAAAASITTDNEVTVFWRSRWA